MTDSVTKNLDIMSRVADVLGSKHIPPHFLCVSHTSEKFDQTCLDVLVDIEKKISLRQMLESSNPELKSFFRGKRCITECAITALCKLISLDASGKSSSLAEEYDLLVEKEGLKKSTLLYKERRFTKLGTTSAAIRGQIDVYEKLLDNTTRNNLLVRASKLYVHCEYIVCALTCLAYFTYKIGMPFLNMIEQSSQKELKEELPRLHKELKSKNLECLADYHVEWTKTKIYPPSSDLEKLITDRMLTAAAEGLRVQRGREYGFFGDEFKQRATEVSSVPDNILKLMPSNNLICERRLSIFGANAERSAKCSNRNFKANVIRDDMTLYQSQNVKRVQVEIRKMLDKREANWNEMEKKLNTKRLEELMEAGREKNKYIDKVLKKCKTWGGPFTSTEELATGLQGTDDKKAREILRHELIYQKQTHPTDATYRKELYLVNKQETCTMKMNLGILLGDNYEESNGDVLLPTETDIMETLKLLECKPPDPLKEQEKDEIIMNQAYAIIWEEDAQLNWFIGFAIEKDNNDITFEYLERSDKFSNLIWNYPKNRWMQVAHKIQILAAEVLSDWDYSNPKKSILHVKNSQEIQDCFNHYIENL